MNTKLVIVLVAVLAVTWFPSDSLGQSTNGMTPEKWEAIAKAIGERITPEERQALHEKIQERKQRDREISQSNWLAVIEGRQPRPVLTPEQTEKFRRVREQETQWRREYFQSKKTFEAALAQAKTSEEAQALIKLHVQRHQEMNAKIRELRKKRDP